MQNTNFDDKYIIEYQQLGSYMKVTAADPVSLVEASIVCPLNVTSNQMAEAAVRKLKYVINKKDKLA